MKMYFRKLPPVAANAFRRAARDTYKPFDPIEGIWHPIYQAECVAMNAEASVYVPDDDATLIRSEHT